MATLVKKYLLPTSLIFLLGSCKEPVEDNPPVWIVDTGIRTFIKNKNNDDLLDAKTVGRYNQKDLKVIIPIDRKDGGHLIDTVAFIDNEIEFDAESNRRFIWILFASNYKQLPLATYLHLSPTDVDTITYEFWRSGSTYQYQPQKLYYNKKLVWEMNEVQTGNEWDPPLIIVK